MKNIYLIRHAQSAANAMPSHGGLVSYRNAEIPITELGQPRPQASPNGCANTPRSPMPYSFPPICAPNRPPAPTSNKAA